MFSYFYKFKPKILNTLLKFPIYHYYLQKVEGVMINSLLFEYRLQLR